MPATRVSFPVCIRALVVHSTFAARIPRQRSANILASVMKAQTPAYTILPGRDAALLHSVLNFFCLTAMSFVTTARREIHPVQSCAAVAPLSVTADTVLCVSQRLRLPMNRCTPMRPAQPCPSANCPFRYPPVVLRSARCCFFHRGCVCIVLLV